MFPFPRSSLLPAENEGSPRIAGELVDSSLAGLSRSPVVVVVQLRRAPPKAGAVEPRPHLLLQLPLFLQLQGGLHGQRHRIGGAGIHLDDAGVVHEELVYLRGLARGGRAPAALAHAGGLAAQRRGRAHRGEHRDLHHDAGEAAAHSGAARRGAAGHLAAGAVLPDVEVAFAALRRAAPRPRAAGWERRRPPQLVVMVVQVLVPRRQRALIPLPDLHEPPRALAQGVIGPRRRHGRGGCRARRLGAAVVVVDPVGPDGCHGKLWLALDARRPPKMDRMPRKEGVGGGDGPAELYIITGGCDGGSPGSAAAKPPGRSPNLAGGLTSRNDRATEPKRCMAACIACTQQPRVRLRANNATCTPVAAAPTYRPFKTAITWLESLCCACGRVPESSPWYAGGMFSPRVDLARHMSLPSDTPLLPRGVVGVDIPMALI
jgi:hypothetical protein